MTIAASAVSGTIDATHRISRTDGLESGRTGPAVRASSTMRSSVLTSASQQALQCSIPAMRGHLDGRLGHAETPGHFAHRLVLEFQRFNHLTLSTGQRRDRGVNRFDIDLVMARLLFP